MTSTVTGLFQMIKKPVSTVLASRTVWQFPVFLTFVPTIFSSDLYTFGFTMACNICRCLRLDKRKGGDRKNRCCGAREGDEWLGVACLFCVAHHRYYKTGIVNPTSECKAYGNSLSSGASPVLIGSLELVPHDQDESSSRVLLVLVPMCIRPFQK